MSLSAVRKVRRKVRLGRCHDGHDSELAVRAGNLLVAGDYLADVLLRVQTHPASRIDELLPHNWTPPRTEPSA